MPGNGRSVCYGDRVYGQGPTTAEVQQFLKEFRAKEVNVQVAETAGGSVPTTANRNRTEEKPRE